MAKKATSRRPAKAGAGAATPAQANAPKSVFTGGGPSIPCTAQPILTHDMIARRAFEIHRSDTGGSALDDWLRAERELRQALGLHALEPSADDGSSGAPPSATD